MSTLSDIYAAFKSVILLQSRIDQLDQRMARMTADMDGLTEAMMTLRDRISRVEGIIEGAAMASGRGSPPRIEG